MSTAKHCRFDTCPDENRLTAMLQGTLTEDEVMEIEEALDRCPSCSALAVELASLFHPSHESAPARRIGRYLIQRQLGAGGMGIVYEAYDESLQRRVALKVLRPDLVEPALREAYSERLLREARLLAALVHPNIPAVYEVGTWDNRLYIAIQLIEGLNLREWVKDNNPSWKEILRAYLQAGKGLASAHQSGVIHRDVKQDNILVSTQGEVFIADFGLARSSQSLQMGSEQAFLAPSNMPQALQPTPQTQGVLGTPSYMAPEQLQGLPASIFSDQYSFGLSLYKTLYSLLPESTQAPSKALDSSVLITDLQMSSVLSLPKGLLKTIRKSLETLPENRFASIELFLQELEKYLSPPSFKNRLKSHKTTFSLVALGSVGMLLFVLFGPKQLFKKPTPPDIHTKQSFHRKKRGQKPSQKPQISSEQKHLKPQKASPSRPKRFDSPSSRKPRGVKSTPKRRQWPPRRVRQLSRRTRRVRQAPKRIRKVRRRSGHYFKRWMSTFKKAQAAQLARRGKRCLHYNKIAWRKNRYASSKPMLQRQRAICLMLVGQCRRGKSLLLRYTRSMSAYPPNHSFKRFMDSQEALYCSLSSLKTLDKKVRGLDIQAAEAKTYRSLHNCKRLERSLWTLWKRHRKAISLKKDWRYKISRTFGYLSHCFYHTRRRCPRIAKLWLQGGLLVRHHVIQRIGKKRVEQSVKKHFNATFPKCPPLK